MKYLISFFCSLLLCVEIFCIKVIPILKETFPLENTDAVMFTLTQNVDGSRDFTISLILRALGQSVVFAILLLLGVWVALLIIRLVKKRNIVKFFNSFSYKKMIVVLNVICIAVFAKSVYDDIPIADYYIVWKDSFSVPEHSAFYKKEYVNPDSAQIEFKEKRNLILVFLESMEYNFQDSVNGGNHPENLIPEITEYLKEGQSFIPGGVQVTGMGWTMADAVAKTCGIPVTFPSSIAIGFKPLKSFLPGVTCLTDILLDNNYNFIVSKGANLKFSGMDDFLNTHSAPQAFGFIEYSRDKKRIQGNVVSEWGVKDSMHYELLKEHIDRLSKQDKPWALWFFTVNTHTPHGIIDPMCNIPENIPEEKRLPAIIKCSSRQLDGFIKWAQKQEWFENTVIAVMGDHAMMAAPELVGFKDTSFTHYWLDFFINSSQTAEKYNREFTSLDMFPTILESMGAEIPNGALGLGRSLYSEESTLLEKYGIDSLNNALGKRSVEYDYFLYFNKNRKK